MQVPVEVNTHHIRFRHIAFIRYSVRGPVFGCLRMHSDIQIGGWRGSIPGMQTLAVLLVLCSAAMHATWNLLAKRSEDPLAFFFALNVTAIVLWCPPMLFMLRAHGLPSSGYAFIVISGCLQVIYFTSLSTAYRNGALSLVYPIARGTGVLLVPVLAFPIFGERPTVLAGAGITAIVAGLAVFGWTGLRRDLERGTQPERAGVLYALATGLTIATYSLVDNAGVSRVHPMVYVYSLIAIAALIPAPYVLTRRRAALGREIRFHKTAVLAGGILSLGTYLIVLFAMRLANVGYVVPLRETSIVFGTLFGVLILKETAARMRIVAAGLVAAGAIAIALWG